MVLVAIDSLTKIIAVNNLCPNVKINFIHNFIDFNLYFNQGSAFGHGSNNPFLVTLFASLILLILIFLFIFLYEPLYVWSISFLIAGTLANLVNRIWYNGTVIDFLDWELFPPEYIFNIADFLVTIGTIFLLVSVFIEEILKELIAKHKKGIK